MTPDDPARKAEQEKLVLAICDEVLALPREQRAALLERRCGGDAGLRAGVESLLQAIDDSGCFLKLEIGEEES